MAKIFDGGSWKDIANPQIMDGGSWKSVQNGFVMKDGTWQSVLSSGGGGQTYEDFLLSQNPEIYLKFDETSGTTAIDASGNYSPGATYGSSSSPIKGIAGQTFIRASNTCPYLSTGSGVIDLNSSFINTSFATIPISGSFIWDLWVKLETTGHILTNWVSGYLSFSIDFSASRQFRCYITCTGGSGYYVTSTTGLDYNWNHISLLYKNKEFWIYLNGVQDCYVNASGFSGGFKTSPHPVQIGTFNNGTTSNITCYVDELAFFANNDWLTPLANKDWWNHL